MAKSLLLWSVVLVFAGGAALAEPLATAPPLFAVDQEEPAPALCMAQEELNGGFPEPKLMAVPICHGDPCTKTSDCRPPGLSECALCFCFGPAFDDKWCVCNS